MRTKTQPTLRLSRFEMLKMFNIAFCLDYFTIEKARICTRYLFLWPSIYYTLGLDFFLLFHTRFYSGCQCPSYVLGRERGPKGSVTEWNGIA